MLRKYFIAGLLVWLPLVVTVWVLEFLVNLIGGWVALLPNAYQPDSLIGMHIPGLAVIVALGVVLITGMLMRNLLGHKLVVFWEELLAKIPLVRSIYGAVKQMLHTFFSGSGESFRKVLLVEYPRQGMWTIAFQTGSGFKEGNEKLGEDLISVFVPTTPNPTAGFLLVLPRGQVMELKMSVDEALKMIISLGVMTPKN